LKSLKLWPRYGDFSIFQNGSGRYAGLLKLKNFNGREEERRTASLCQISSKSLETRQIFGYFQIFQDGGRRHLGFSKF